MEVARTVFPGTRRGLLRRLLVRGIGGAHAGHRLPLRASRDPSVSIAPRNCSFANAAADFAAAGTSCSYCVPMLCITTCLRRETTISVRSARAAAHAMRDEDDGAPRRLALDGVSDPWPARLGVDRAQLDRSTAPPAARQSVLAERDALLRRPPGELDAALAGGGVELPLEAHRLLETPAPARRVADATVDLSLSRVVEGEAHAARTVDRENASCCAPADVRARARRRSAGDSCTSCPSMRDRRTPAMGMNRAGSIAMVLPQPVCRLRSRIDLSGGDAGTDDRRRAFCGRHTRRVRCSTSISPRTDVGRRQRADLNASPVLAVQGRCETNAAPRSPQR